MTILIIEDDTGIYELLKEKLEEHGYETAGVISAAEALAWLEDHSPHLMVLDYHLPDMNGKELIEELKKKKQPLPDFIVATGQGDERIAVDMMKLGARDYIIKDAYFLDLLPEVVRRVDKEIENENKLKQVEEALRESEVKYRQVVENATEGIFVIQDDSYCYVNQRVAEIFNTTRERILSGELYEFVHPDDRMACANRVSLRKQGETTEELLVHRIIDALGNEKWVEVRGVSIIWEGRHASMCFLIDITERKRAEEMLEMERAQLLSIFDSIDEIIYVTDPYTYEILYVNQTMKDAFQKELMGGVCYREFQGLDAPCEFCTNGIILKQKPASHHWEHHNSDIEKDFDIVDRIIKWPDGRDVRFELAIDITERKQAEKEKARLEEQYLQAQKVEAIGRLAGGVAHDLNNLLVPILGYGEMLMDDFAPTDVRRESVKQIVNAGFKARDLVRQLLAFGRKQSLKYKTLDLNTIIRRFEKLMRRTIRENIDIKIILSPDIRLIMADIGQIEQVIMNLAINAQDAMPEGGRLTIETSMTELDEEYAASRPDVKPGLYVMLAVSDIGCGMDDETHGLIFEPFFSTKGDQGTGMGLATVYGIVKQHGGNIWVYSEPGKGATFKIYLPVSEEAHIETIAKEKRVGNLLGSETILLVEDNEQVRRLAHAILKNRGYTVLTAENGSDALAVLASHAGPVHLLMTDVVMPGMNGKELFNKATEKHPDLIALYMSGYTDNVIAHHGVLDEGVHFIQKPFSVNSLAAKVREALDND